jgi:hypothetical protein
MAYKITEDLMSEMLNPTKQTWEPLPEGTYVFETIDAELVQTKTPPPRPRLVLNLKVYDEKGGSRTVRDGILLSEDWGVRNLSEYYRATGGLPPDPSVVDIAAFKMRSGKVKLKIKRDDHFGDSNDVSYYVQSDEKAGPVVVPDLSQLTAEAAGEDDIPF